MSLHTYSTFTFSLNNQVLDLMNSFQNPGYYRYQPFERISPEQENLVAKGNADDGEGQVRTEHENSSSHDGGQTSPSPPSNSQQVYSHLFPSDILVDLTSI